jgi:hypothetical protein
MPGGVWAWLARQHTAEMLQRCNFKRDRGLDMAFQLLSATFEDSSLGLKGARTEDGQILSLLFNRLAVESLATDLGTGPQARRAEGQVRCEGSGWVSVQVRGVAAVVGEHGYAHLIGWANGRPLRMMVDSLNEPFSACVSAPVGVDGVLRLSLLLLAQRDLAETASEAACWLDSIDIAITPGPRAIHG